MTPERHKQICQLFGEALELAPENRAAWLAQSCGADVELRAEVEKLMAHHCEDGEFLDRPVLDVAAELLAQKQRTPLPGQKISHYEILAQLGAGGMGEVWLAEDPRLGRKVALKLLPDEFATDPDRLRRFEKEAKAASATDHPNIVVIHEIGASDGTLYIAQEYVEGETLRSRIGRGPIPVLEALDIARQTANALAAAHSAGIVHRDIKPENIMLRRDGFVKVLDFGLAEIQRTEARSIEHSSAQTLQQNTAPGVILGTINYMSPEQTRGQKLDARSDLWSLGVVLYEMLTGQLPFQGESIPDIFVAILERQPAPLIETLADPAARLAAQLEQILNKLLAKNREDRYHSSAQLAAELKRFHHRLELDAERETNAVLESPTLFIRQPVQTIEHYAERPTRDEQKNSAEPMSFWSPPGVAGVFRQAQNHKVLSSIFALVLIAIISAAAYLSLYRPGAAREIDSIAVLPFENLSGNPDLAYLSDGLSESLIDRLSELPQLKVISRNSSFKFREANIDVRKVASQLGVRAVLTGSVAKVGEDLVIRFDIVDAADDRQIAGGQYRQKGADILRVQNEVAQAASEKLRLKLTDSQSKRFGRNATENSEAYHYYLNGLVELNGPQDVRGKALEYFERAVSLDPGFAEAHAEIAWVYVGQATGSGDPRELMPKAKAAIERALRIDPNLAKAHALLAIVNGYEFDWLGAEKEYLRAIELSPNLDFTRNNYAFFLSVIGRHDEALAELEQQGIRDPINRRLTLLQKGIILTQARRFDDALQTYQEAQTVEPDKNVPFSSLGYAYAGKGLYSEAAGYYKKSVDLLGGEEKYSQSLVYLAATYAKMPEKRNEARAILTRIEAMRKYASPSLLAAVYSALGDYDKSMELLEQAYNLRDPLLPYVGTGYEYDGLRADPRFKAMLKRLNLPEQNFAKRSSER
jgi:serine/threonine-protein kinase